MKIKAKDLRNMSEKELTNKFVELKKDLIKKNAQVAAGTVPENPGQVKNVKKTIARILTIKTEKQKGAKQEKKK
jgi:large subunit ribosomal protein L29